jgi:hypothetical protein
MSRRYATGSISPILILTLLKNNICTEMLPTKILNAFVIFGTPCILAVISGEPFVGCSETWTNIFLANIVRLNPSLAGCDQRNFLIIFYILKNKQTRVNSWVIFKCKESHQTNFTSGSVNQ